jgi:hypothetical protein
MKSGVKSKLKYYFYQRIADSIRNVLKISILSDFNKSRIFIFLSSIHILDFFF